MKHVTKTPAGLMAHRRLDGHLYAKRFPRDTPPAIIRRWLTSVEFTHRTRPRTGTFAADAKKYLRAVTPMPTYDQRARHIAAWVEAFGPLNRVQITPAMIRTKLAEWRTTPKQVRQRHKLGEPERTRTVTLSAASCNKLRTALVHLYTVLDGKAAYNPAREVPKFPEPAPLPLAVTYDVIAKLFEAMPASKAKARLKVLAYTGIPHAEIMRIQPGDVNLETRLVAVHGRRKGAGTAARIVPLSDEGVQAFDAMATEGAWGAFSQSALRRVLLRACQRVGVPPVTPYALRHSFGTEIYLRSGDIRATQVLMGHSTPQLTHRYTLGAVDPRVLTAIRAWKKP